MIKLVLRNRNVYKRVIFCSGFSWANYVRSNSDRNKKFVELIRGAVPVHQKSNFFSVARLLHSAPKSQPTPCLPRAP